MFKSDFSKLKPAAYLRDDYLLNFSGRLRNKFVKNNHTITKVSKLFHSVKKLENVIQKFS